VQKDGFHQSYGPSGQGADSVLPYLEEELRAKVIDFDDLVGTCGTDPTSERVEQISNRIAWPPHSLPA
jgi:ribose 1,5-bisphosphokinase PhnN